MEDKGQISYSDWISDRKTDIIENGFGGVKRFQHDVLVELLRRGTRLTGKDTGESVLDRDWDLLIILDACRYDLFEEVVDEYPFLSSYEPFWSAGSTSKEWIEANLDRERFGEELDEVAYVTGNPFSEGTISDSELGLLDEVWKRSWDENLSVLPPRPLTEQTVRVGRNHDFDRVIVHYMQPHFPFLDALDIVPGDMETDVWRAVYRGRLDRDAVWDAYRENLRTVLDEVEILLSNFDADRAVISSDHGNAFGEWGIYGHPGHLPLASLRRVPWAVVSAEDERTLDVEERADETEDDVVEERLRDLGYV